ncbi:MAG: hypothetical protein WCI51_07275 [Lentisphaerota bacterium]
MKILDGLFILAGTFCLLSIPADAASNYGRTSADMVYQSRVGPNSQSAKEDRALLKDLTRYDPYMKDQFIPSSSISGSTSTRGNTRVGYQMEKLESLNSGELTPEQYRATMQDFIRSRASTPQVKKNDIKYGSNFKAEPAIQPKSAEAAVKKTPEKEKKKSELKNPIDEYLDKLAEKQDKAKAAELKNSTDVTDEIKKNDAPADKKPVISNDSKPDKNVKDQGVKAGNSDAIKSEGKS